MNDLGLVWINVNPLDGLFSGGLCGRVYTGFILIGFTHFEFLYLGATGLGPSRPLHRKTFLSLTRYLSFTHEPCHPKLSKLRPSTVASFPCLASC